MIIILLCNGKNDLGMAVIWIGMQWKWYSYESGLKDLCLVSRKMRVFYKCHTYNGMLLAFCRSLSHLWQCCFCKHIHIQPKIASGKNQHLTDWPWLTDYTPASDPYAHLSLLSVLFFPSSAPQSWLDSSHFHLDIPVLLLPPPLYPHPISLSHTPSFPEHHPPWNSLLVDVFLCKNINDIHISPDPPPQHVRKQIQFHQIEES